MFILSRVQIDLSKSKDENNIFAYLIDHGTTGMYQLNNITYLKPVHAQLKRQFWLVSPTCKFITQYAKIYLISSHFHGYVMIMID